MDKEAFNQTDVGRMIAQGEVMHMAMLESIYEDPNAVFQKSADYVAVKLLVNTFTTAAAHPQRGKPSPNMVHILTTLRDYFQNFALQFHGAQVTKEDPNDPLSLQNAMRDFLYLEFVACNIGGEYEDMPPAPFMHIDCDNDQKLFEMQILYDATIGAQLVNKSHQGLVDNALAAIEHVVSQAPRRRLG